MPKTIERYRNVDPASLPPPPIARLLGVRLIALADTEAVFEMDAGPQHHNPMGTVHGGVFCDLADAAMGFAYRMSIDETESFTTLELKLNFLKPVREGRLTARGRVVKGGKTTGLVECDITDEKGALVARASSTCLTLRGEMAAGR